MRARSIGAALAASLLAAVVVHADYRDNFAKGVRATQFRQWDKAIRFFRAAIAERPRETGQNVNISGFGNFEPYLPHYFLGVAQMGLGDCVNALKEWRTSEGQGRVQTRTYAARIQRNITVCETRLAMNAANASTPPTGTASAHTLVIDALPWAEIVEIRDASNRPVALKAGSYTPFAVKVPPGWYTVTLRAPDGARPKITSTVVVDASRGGRLFAEFRKVDAEAYFSKALVK